ncbi:MAG: creatininase family protein [Thermoanaerobaculia bacterium]|nr:creatininase family protein [Thermoanaerobaculia bacterium]
MTRWADLTWKEIQTLLERQTPEAPLVAILPCGATEAHGRHLPLQTDRIIANAMAERGAGILKENGLSALVLPPLDYTAAPFARGFAGTLSVRPETVTALVVDVGLALARQGARVLVFANAHFDPAHLGALYEAIEELTGRQDASDLRIIFPDVTRKRWASRLTDEFQSGACHAGRYEGSIVLAARRDLVRDEIRRDLPPRPVSLSEAIRRGQTSFEQAGGAEAYFGDPAAASAEEGHATIQTLGEILFEAVRAAIDDHLGGQGVPSLS